MRIKGKLYLSVASIALAGFLAGVPAQLSAQQAPPGVTIGTTDLGGVVSGPNGPEAGVWVIAETNDLPTRYAKIVVTDGQGRYVVPDLPKANYSIWVRGYGLVDSPKVKSEPGKIGNLTSVPAPTLGYRADWTERIAKGDLPPATPKRPDGLERNIVVTTWDWSDEKHYLHDLVATDKRNPTVNAGGALYGQPEYSMDYFPVLDPKTSTASVVKAPI